MKEGAGGSACAPLLGGALPKGVPKGVPKGGLPPLDFAEGAEDEDDESDEGATDGKAPAGPQPAPPRPLVAPPKVSVVAEGSSSPPPAAASSSSLDEMGLGVGLGAGLGAGLGVGPYAAVSADLRDLAGLEAALASAGFDRSKVEGVPPPPPLSLPSLGIESQVELDRVEGRWFAVLEALPSSTPSQSFNVSFHVHSWHARLCRSVTKADPVPGRVRPRLPPRPRLQRSLALGHGPSGRRPRSQRNCRGSLCRLCGV